MLARSVLYMQPREGRRDAFVKAFSELGIADAAMRQRGCLGVELQVPDDDGPVLVTALWKHREDYQGWLENPIREATREEIERLVEEAPHGIVYELPVVAGALERVDVG